MNMGPVKKEEGGEVEKRARALKCRVRKRRADAERARSILREGRV